MPPDIIIPAGTLLGELFGRLVARQRIVFFAGLPGVGKSLLVQQLALMAQRAGRSVHLLQWDVTRAAFETDGILARYPESDGVTHIAIRKAVGFWARDAVHTWHVRHEGPEHLLIGEVTLVGNRLIELAEVRTDAAEELLDGAHTLFLIPVPSRQVRAAIECAREQSIASPRHQRESADAPPNVLQALWLELCRLAHQLGLAENPGDGPIPYDPDVYAAAYRHLLRQRRAETLPIESVLRSQGSVYDLDLIASELAASPSEVERVMWQVEHGIEADSSGGGTISTRF